MAAEETRASPAPASSAKAAIPKTSRAAATAPVPSSPSKSGFFRLLKGGFRAVSGLIGRVDHEEYRVSTPVATIGIRGTDYYVYQCDAACDDDPVIAELIGNGRSEEHTSELQSLMRISYAVFCLKKKKTILTTLQ